MNRLFPGAVVLVAVSAFAAMRAQNGRKPSASTSHKPFTVVEATIPEMRAAMEQGRATSRDIVQQYLSRIATYEDRLHAAITVNPKALELADERDRERAQGKIRGPLHGIPIALKDNIHTTDMRTTGGALAFESLMPPYEATLTKNLREAGAIIIAKTGMTELANWVAGAPTPMPGNYNGLAGYGYNPYDPRRDPRDATFDGRAALATGGSSSGVGTAANFWAANVGTETSGSVLSPSNQNMLAGSKPTVGRSRQQGAVVVDPADIPSVVDNDAKNNLLLWNTCSGANEGKGRDAECSVDFKYGMKRDFNAWLKSLGSAAPFKSLTELREWNIAHQKAGAIKYGQSNLDVSDEMDVEADRARYEMDRAKDIRLGGTHGIDEVMKRERLDGILFPAASGAAIAAKPGYPTVIVPFATVPNAPTPPFPAGFDAKPSPYGVSFTGMACSEPKLIELAYAFEQATRKRLPPPLFP